MLGSKLIETEVSRHVTLGQNALIQLPDIVDDLHLGKQGIIIHDGITFLNLEELANSIKIKIEQSTRRLSVFNISLITGNHLDEFITTISKLKPRFLIAIGDNSTIEFVKYIIKHIADTNVEWISIPVTAMHDGLASPFIFLDLKGTGEEYYGISKPPIAIIADTDLIKKAPQRTLHSGIGDLLGKVTSVWDWKLAARLRSESISDFSALVAEENCRIVSRQLEIVQPDDKDYLNVILKGLIITGFLGGFSGNVRSVYGAEHKFNQALDAIKPGETLHGERVALGSIMMASLQGQNWRALRKTYKRAGVPVTASELDLKPSSIVKALINAVNYPKNKGKYSFYSILGEKGLTEDAAVRLAYRTGIIGTRLGLD